MKRELAIRIISNHIYELNVEPDECEYEANLILKQLERYHDFKWEDQDEN